MHAILCHSWYVILILCCLKFTDGYHNQRRENTKVAGDGCTLDKRQYRVGDIWHPDLPPFGKMSCVNCTCLQDGEVRCDTNPCPKADCVHPKMVHGECCPVCPDDLWNVVPTVARGDDDGKPDDFQGCSYHGQRFNHGDMFPSNKTAIRPTRNDQCVLCACMNGRVLCYLKSCPRIQCKQYIVPQAEDCCPICKEDLELSFSSGGDDGEMWSDYNNNSTGYTENDCFDGSSMRRNGTDWHPIVAPFGMMKCIVCACQDGNVECGRVTCPPRESLPCRRPRQLGGSCCEECPPRRPRKERRKKKKKKGRRKGDAEKKDNDGANGKTPTSRDETGIRFDNSNMFANLCLPNRSDRMVYTSPGSDDLYVLAFDIPKKKAVEIYKWRLNPKGRILSMVKELMLTDLFRNQRNITLIVGATNKRHYKKFKRKVDRQWRRCERKKRPCRKKVMERIVRKIRMRKVRISEECENRPS